MPPLREPGPELAVFGDAEHCGCGMTNLSFFDGGGGERSSGIYSSFHFMVCMNQRQRWREEGGKEREGERGRVGGGDTCRLSSAVFLETPGPHISQSDNDGHFTCSLMAPEELPIKQKIYTARPAAFELQ